MGIKNAKQMATFVPIYRNVYDHSLPNVHYGTAVFNMQLHLRVSEQHPGCNMTPDSCSEWKVGSNCVLRMTLSLSPKGPFGPSLFPLSPNIHMLRMFSIGWFDHIC